MRKRKSLEELQEIARKLTQDILGDYIIPEEILPNLTLGVLFRGDDRVFELYVPGEKPQDGKVITRVVVNSYTGNASPVEVFLEEKRPEK